MIPNPEERLQWLEKHQPRNFSAINALRTRLNLPILPISKKPSKKRAQINRAGGTIYPFSKGYIQRQKAAVTIHY